MRFYGLLSLGLLAVLPALVPSIDRAADAPRFRPRSGVKIKRVLEAKGTRELRSMVIQVGEKEQNIQDVEATFSLSAKYTILDDYLEVADGRVLRLARTFASLKKMNTETRPTHGSEDPPKEIPETCALEGDTVVFTWNADRKVYVPKLDSRDHGDAPLDKLNFDMDYGHLLPPPGTAEGTQWKVDISDAKTAILRPAGHLPFKPPTPPDAMDVRLRDAAWDGTSGQLELEWKALPETEGSKLAAISFEGTIEIAATVTKRGETNGPDKLGTRSSEKIHGELVWDLSRGGPRAIQWSSKGTAKVRITGKQPTESGSAFEMEQILSFDQDYAFKGTFTVE